MKEADDEISEPSTLSSIVLALPLLLCFGAAADWVERTMDLNQPAFLIGLAGILLLTDVLPGRTRRAMVAVYRFTARVFSIPVLIVVGLLFSPWDLLIAGFSIDNVIIVSATVASLLGVGYLGSLWMGLDPIEGSIVAISRSAMGGTGDIAMLSAARRLDLMPFSQFVTRLGGAVTIFVALLLL